MASGSSRAESFVFSHKLEFASHTFGYNALQFSIFFWLAVVVRDDSRITLRDVRFEIDRLFREAGIIIAFPQRDVHLSTDAPLEVRIVDRPLR
jgi:potassium efflux system protein